MLVLITDTGRVEQRVVELPGPIDADDVTELRPLLNAALGGAAARRTPPQVAGAGRAGPRRPARGR